MPDDRPNDAQLDLKLRRRATAYFDAQQAEARQIAENPGALRSLLDAGRDWLGRFSEKLNPNTKSGLTTIYRMIAASVSGEYRGLSPSTLAYLTAAVLYCVSPIDAIPDVVPILGLADDAFIVAWTLKKIAGETKTFRNWERLRDSKSTLSAYFAQFNAAKRVVLCPGWLTENADGAEIAEILRPIFPNATFDFYRWRSNVSWSEARQYVDSDGAADLEAFLRRSPFDLSSVVLFGHSLGSRLAIRTLARLSREPRKLGLWSRRPTNRVAQAILTGAAIDADDADLDAAVRGSNAPICNFFNRSDRVLSYLYRAAEQKTPLGLSGAESNRENYVDCVVSGREEYWLDVAENVASILTFLKSRSAPTKFSLADDFAQNAATFHRHQFVQYAKFFRDAFDAKIEIADAEPPALPGV